MRVHRTPDEIVHTLVGIGEIKVNKTIKKTLLAAILAGIFISLGSIGYVVMAGKIRVDPGLGTFMGAFVFPVGLVMVILLGGELFTGNSLMTFGVAKKRYTFGHLVRNWAIVWTGNLIGAIGMVLLAWGGKIFTGDVATKARAIAEIKVSHGLLQTILLGVLCNIIVVLVVMLQMAARDITGTVLLISFGILLFALSGYEHIVANMFFIPAGKLFGANITWMEIITKNFIPVTIGNIIGGAVIVPLIYYGIYHKDLDQIK